MQAYLMKNLAYGVFHIYIILRNQVIKQCTFNEYRPHLRRYNLCQ